MITFNSDNIINGEIKELLSSFNLPSCRILVDGKPIIIYKDFTYIYKENLLRARATKMFKAFDYNDEDFYFLSFYDEGREILNITHTTLINSNIYDSYTHKKLGDYLRFQKDFKDLDLMSMYNCFSGDCALNVRLEVPLQEGKIAEFNSDTSLYKIYVVPVRFWETYSIYMDCSSKVEIISAFYRKGNLVSNLASLNGSSDVLNNFYTKSYITSSNLRFDTPLTYNFLQNCLDESDSSKTLFGKEDDLCLLIKVPFNNDSSLVVIEGNKPIEVEEINGFHLEEIEWQGHSDINGSSIWSDSGIYYSSDGLNRRQYMLDGEEWKSNTFYVIGNTPDLSIDGAKVWKRGNKVYYTDYSNQSQLSKEVFPSYEAYTNDNLIWPSALSSGAYGRYVWSDGNNTYYSNGNNQFILNDNTWETHIWGGSFTSFNGSNVWTDGSTIYYQDQYYLDGNEWKPMSWSSLPSNFMVSCLWTDGVNIYHTYISTYVLDISTHTWTQVTWGSGSQGTITYGNCIWNCESGTYYNQGSTTYKLSDNVWNSITVEYGGISAFDSNKLWKYENDLYFSNGSYTWRWDDTNLAWNKLNTTGLLYPMSQFNDLMANSIWNDGTNVYCSQRAPSSRQLKKLENDNVFATMTWTGLTSFSGSEVWKDLNNNIYYSSSTTQKVLNGTRWSNKTWYGLTDFSGNNIWTDGVNIYYSNGSNANYILEGDTWTLIRFSGIPYPHGNNIFNYLGHTYCLEDNNLYIFNSINKVWELERDTMPSELLGTGQGKYIWNKEGKLYYSEVVGNISYQYRIDFDFWRISHNPGVSVNWDDEVAIKEIRKEYISSLNTYTTKSQLLILNDKLHHPFADRLVEYITKNTIDQNDDIGLDIKRVEDNLNEKGIETEPNNHHLWNKSLRNTLYLLANERFVNKNGNSSLSVADKYYDVLGYVDKDVEEYIVGEYNYNDMEA